MNRQEREEWEASLKEEKANFCVVCVGIEHVKKEIVDEGIVD